MNSWVEMQNIEPVVINVASPGNISLENDSDNISIGSGSETQQEIEGTQKLNVNLPGNVPLRQEDEDLRKAGQVVEYIHGGVELLEIGSVLLAVSTGLPLRWLHPEWLEYDNYLRFSQLSAGVALLFFESLGAPSHALRDLFTFCSFEFEDEPTLLQALQGISSVAIAFSRFVITLDFPLLSLKCLANEGNKDGLHLLSLMAVALLFVDRAPTTELTKKGQGALKQKNKEKTMPLLGYPIAAPARVFTSKKVHHGLEVLHDGFYILEGSSIVLLSIFTSFPLNILSPSFASSHSGLDSYLTNAGLLLTTGETVRAYLQTSEKISKVHAYHEQALDAVYPALKAGVLTTALGFVVRLSSDADSKFDILTVPVIIAAGCLLLEENGPGAWNFTKKTSVFLAHAAGQAVNAGHHAFNKVCGFFIKPTVKIAPVVVEEDSSTLQKKFERARSLAIKQAMEADNDRRNGLGREELICEKKEIKFLPKESECLRDYFRIARLEFRDEVFFEMPDKNACLKDTISKMIDQINQYDFRDPLDPCLPLTNALATGFYKKWNDIKNLMGPRDLFCTDDFNEKKDAVIRALEQLKNTPSLTDDLAHLLIEAKIRSFLPSDEQNKLLHFLLYDADQDLRKIIYNGDIEKPKSKGLSLQISPISSKVTFSNKAIEIEIIDHVYNVTVDPFEYTGAWSERDNNENLLYPDNISLKSETKKPVCYRRPKMEYYGKYTICLSAKDERVILRLDKATRTYYHRPLEKLGKELGFESIQEQIPYQNILRR
jgi:hypothetical protein